MDKKIRLEIGAGENPRRGYIHCDVRLVPGIDCVCNASQLPFADNSVDKILASHVLEHLTAREGELALRVWFRVLKRGGGEIIIDVPDLEGHIRQYWLEGNSRYYPGVTNREHAMAGFYGWQRFTEDVHKWGYSFQSLSNILEHIGFNRIRRLDSYLLWLTVEAHKDTGWKRVEHKERKDGLSSLISRSVLRTFMGRGSFVRRILGRLAKSTVGFLTWLDSTTERR